MSSGEQRSVGPMGGLRMPRGALRGWHWTDDETLQSAPVRCKREQWYLARARVAESNGLKGAELVTQFLRDGEPLGTRCVGLKAVAEDGVPNELLGWVQAPEDATHLRLQLARGSEAADFEQVVFHPVAERDPKCHPLANVPRWSTYRPPFPLARVVLPAALGSLAPLLKGRQVEVAPAGISVRKLERIARGAAVVFDPDWVSSLDLRLSNLERLAAASWLIVDLETLAMLVDATGRAAPRVVTRAAGHEIMSARVEYADVATRGFALQDVLPYSTTRDGETFRVRVLTANRSWKRYADGVAFATLLASETPNAKECGDVLSAARPIARGELIATDLPWIVAGLQGRMLAPRLARHLLDMHLGGALDEGAQYWNRWDESDIVVRDIADLARHHPPLRTLRWASPDPGLVHLGIGLIPAPRGHRLRNLLIRTGRIDNLAAHGGMPPEPMVIFLKWLAREQREQTAWARRYLGDLAVCWQFDSAAGLRHAAGYESAAVVDALPAEDVVLQCSFAGRADRQAVRGAGPAALVSIGAELGIHGDGSLEFQAELTRRLRGIIEYRRG